MGGTRIRMAICIYQIELDILNESQNEVDL